MAFPGAVLRAATLLWVPWVQVAAQLYDPRVLDFTPWGETKVETTADVIRGIIQIQAPITADDIKKLEPYFREMLAIICETKVRVILRMYQEIMSLHKVSINLKALYYLLPDNRDSVSCRGGLPYADSLKKLLAVRIAMDTVNGPAWDPTSWGFTLEPPMVLRRSVFWPERLPLPELSTTPPGLLAKKEVALNRGGGGYTGPNASALNDPNCKFAASACLCATTEKCKWDIWDGGYRCMGSDDPTEVSCALCGLQLRCSRDQTQGCQMYQEPCTCAMSTAGCRWDLRTMTCVVSGGLSTGCSTCSRQATCDPPKRLSFSPDTNSLFGTGFMRHLTVKFDRPVRLQGMLDGVVLKCGTQLITVPMDLQKITDKDLLIEISATHRTEEEVPCVLSLAEGVVRDEDDLGFVGEENAYRFRLADSVAPRIVSLRPANGAEDTPLNTAAELAFSEPIRTELGCLVTLWEKDTQLASFVLGSEVAAVSEDRLSIAVAVGAHLQRGKSYSIRLPPGCVKDDSNNLFPGLLEGVYIFQTESPTFVATDGEDPAALIIALTASCAAGVVILCSSVVLCCRFRHAKDTFGTRLKEQADHGRRWSIGSLEDAWNELSQYTGRVRRSSFDRFQMAGLGRKDKKAKVHPEPQDQHVAAMPPAAVMVPAPPPRSVGLIRPPASEGKTLPVGDLALSATDISEDPRPGSADSLPNTGQGSKRSAGNLSPTPPRLHNLQGPRIAAAAPCPPLARPPSLIS